MRTSIEEAQLAARSSHVQLQLLEVSGPGDFDSVFEAAKKHRAEAPCQRSGMALSMFGTKHIMFGTDIPLREDIELQLRDIAALDLSAADLNDIYAGNAARLLGITTI